MSTIQQPPEVSSIKSQFSAEFLFRNLCFLINAILALCIPGFMNFRQYCEEHDLYVFSLHSIKWCILGFFLVSVRIDLFRPPATPTTDS